MSDASGQLLGSCKRTVFVEVVGRLIVLGGVGGKQLLADRLGCDRRLGVFGAGQQLFAVVSPHLRVVAVAC